jgi:hypothetical protein
MQKKVVSIVIGRDTCRRGQGLTLCSIQLEKRYRRDLCKGLVGEGVVVEIPVKRR